MNSRYDELKYEFKSPSFRQKMKEQLGNVCVNCHCEKEGGLINYHHIVPLALGGTNNMSNIVPLCKECHYHAHSSRDINKLYHSKNIGGRPRIVPPDNYKEVLNDYMCGKISQKRCKILLRIRGKNKLTDMIYYKDYLDELGVHTCRNHLDHISERDNMPPNRVISYIVYQDGRKETFLANGEILSSKVEIKKKRK